MSARLFVGHHAGPDPRRIQIIPGFIDESFWFGIENARSKSIADQSTLTIFPVGVETVADHGLAVAHAIGNDGH